MLRWIRVFNIAVIDQLEVDFEAGLNLLTGETGAGKSILIDAVGLLLGARASTDLVRSGAQTARVEAGFELESFPRQLRRRLAGVGIDAEGGELIIRREVSAGGRGKVIVNGCATAASLLREVAPFLMDIHGQSEHLSLLRPDAGLELLDRVAGC
ncbi:MAG: AAA family ATPase, partial [Acidobacteriota bacterium]